MITDWFIITALYTWLFYSGYFAAFLTNPHSAFNEFFAYAMALEYTMDGILSKERPAT